MMPSSDAVSECCNRSISISEAVTVSFAVVTVVVSEIGRMGPRTCAILLNKELDWLVGEALDRIDGVSTRRRYESRLLWSLWISLLFLSCS